jgi:hypothetical protein
MVNGRHAERGQSIPFWVFSLIACLAITFFVNNYTNQIRWTIRAQNAADAVAASAIVPDVDLSNQATLTLYAEAIDEARLRYLNQAIINILQGYGCSDSTSCKQDYNALTNAYRRAIIAYNPQNNGGLHLDDLDVAQNTGNLQTAETNAYNAAASGCASTPPIGDCTNGQPTFKYHVVPGTTLGNGFADVYACAMVPTIIPSLLKLPMSSQFKAIARSTMGIGSHTETFTPGVTINPSTGQPYAQRYYPSSLADQNYYTYINFSSLSVTLHFFSAATVQPTASFNPSTATC